MYGVGGNARLGKIKWFFGLDLVPFGKQAKTQSTAKTSKIFSSVLKSYQPYIWARHTSNPNTSIAKTQKFVKPPDKEW